MPVKRQACTVDGVHYESENAVARALNIGLGAVRHRLRSSNYPEYVSKHHPKEDCSNERLVPCSIAGIEYKSTRHAAKELGISPYKVKRRLSSLDYPDYVCAGIPKKPTTPAKSDGYPCTINGVPYKSEKEAAEALGVYTSGLRIRLRSPNFPEYVSKHHPKKNTGRFVPCSVAGVEYKSVGSAAGDLGISYGEMTRRLVSPDYPDYVCAKYPKKPTKAFKYDVKGKQYKTLREAANAEGATTEQIRRKMNSPKHPDYQRL